MKFVKTILLFAAALFLFVGSVGVDIFSHLCEKEHLVVSYFTEEDDHCHNNEVEAQDSCCPSENDCEGDCCDNEMQHVQVKLDYFQHVSLVPVVLPDVSLRIFMESSDAVLQANTSVYHENPPPLSGREVLLKKQYWLI